MTVSQSIVLVLLIALWATGNGVDLTNNTTLLIILLIALVALARATNQNFYCPNNVLTTTSTNSLFPTFI